MDGAIMKLAKYRTILGILCLLLVGAWAYVEARTTVVVVGGGVSAAAPSCSTSTDGVLVDIDDTDDDNRQVRLDRIQAQSFSYGATWTLTAYDLKLKDVNNTGGFDVCLYTDSGGNPSAEVAGTCVSVTAATIADDDAYHYEVALATPKTGLSASTTYWVRLIGTGTNPTFLVYISAAGYYAGGVHKYDNGGGWTLDGDMVVNILGCAD